MYLPILQELVILFSNIIPTKTGQINIIEQFYKFSQFRSVISKLKDNVDYVYLFNCSCLHELRHCVDQICKYLAV